MGKNHRKFKKDVSGRNWRAGGSKYFKPCNGKTRYRDREQAKKAASYIMRCGVKNETGIMRPYYCPDCAGWHLSKQRES